MFRLDRAYRHNFVHFDDGRRRRHRHNGIEIPRRHTVGQVAKFIRGFRFDKGVVRMDGHFQDAALPLDDAFFFSSSDFRSHTDGRVKPLQTGGSSPHSFAEDSLRHQLKSHFSFVELLLKINGMRAWK